MVLEIRMPGAPDPLRSTVRRPLTLGGSQVDGIVVAGLPPSALRLTPLPAGLVLSPAAVGLRVAGRVVAPGGLRLLRPGERARFLDVALALATAPAGDRTRVAAAALLRRARRDPDAPAGPHLVILSGPHAGARAALGAGMVLGRGRGADLRIADDAASRRHARIAIGVSGVTAHDLGAKNRLRVNGVPVERKKPVPLRPGDLLTVGETELAYEGPPATPAAAPGARARRTRPHVPGLRALVAAALLAASAAALATASCG